MLTVVLFALVLLSILGMLFGKAAILYLLRPSRTVTYLRCAVLEWAAFALSVVGGLALIVANVTAEGTGRSTVCCPPMPPIWPLSSPFPKPASRSAAQPDLTHASQQAVAFLARQYDDQVGLLRESPSVAPNRYWLAVDNVLAWHALTAAGQVTWTARLDAAFVKYDRPRHGLVEILGGQIVAWPPNVATQAGVARCGAAEIWLETRTDGDRYQDWGEYADLALYGVLLSRNGGQYTEARRQYQDAMRLFDGVGFADRAFRVDGVYATYKLALAILAGQAVGEPVDPWLWNALLSKQAGVATPTAYVGGFYALYDRQGQPLNDPNTETTSLALLALHALAGVRNGN